MNKRELFTGWALLAIVGIFAGTLFVGCPAFLGSDARTSQATDSSLFLATAGVILAGAILGRMISTRELTSAAVLVISGLVTGAVIILGIEGEMAGEVPKSLFSPEGAMAILGLAILLLVGVGLGLLSRLIWKVKRAD